MIEINGKVYRNLQEQVEKNKDDIAEIKEHGTGESYSAGTGINISDENVISIDNTVETKANATSRFVSKDNLTDYSINQIIVGNSDQLPGQTVKSRLQECEQRFLIVDSKVYRIRKWRVSISVNIR